MEKLLTWILIKGVIIKTLWASNNKELLNEDCWTVCLKVTKKKIAKKVPYDREKSIKFSKPQFSPWSTRLTILYYLYYRVVVRFNSNAYKCLTLVWHFQVCNYLFMPQIQFIHYSKGSDYINCMLTMYKAVELPTWSSGAKQHIGRRVCWWGKCGVPWAHTELIQSCGTRDITGLLTLSTLSSLWFQAASSASLTIAVAS